MVEGWHDVAKTRNYSAETRAKAIRLVREHAGDYASEFAAITAVASRLGMTPETLRKWIRQAEVDEGAKPGVSTAEAAEVRALRRKVSELERTIAILTEATRFLFGGHPVTAVICAFIASVAGRFGVVPACRALSAHGVAISPRTYWARRS
jgi:transposase